MKNKKLKLSQKNNTPSSSNSSYSHPKDSSDYEKIISDASNAINRMFETEYIDLLDRRAKAKAMTSRFASAIEDAKEMIKYLPQSSRGYIRAGESYSMQGREADAAVIYEKGQTMVDKKDPNYNMLVQGGKTARSRTEQRIDMIARMPLETTFHIFEQLSLETLGACINVSNVWRGRLFKCGQVWKTLSSTGNQRVDIAICHSIASIGKHVKNLTLSCKDKSLRSLYLDHMKNGCFTQLSHLVMTKDMTYTVNRELTAIGLWQMRNTLTQIDVDFTDNKVILSLSAILTSAPQLIWLYYKTSAPLRKAAGDPTALIRPHGLKQLNVESSLIYGDDIQPILSNCQQLRTLVAIGCDTTVMDTVLSCCSQLEFFGYNTDAHLTHLSKSQAERTKSTGLRVLDMGTPVHIEQLLPYFTRHAPTLRVAFVCLNELFPEELLLLDAWAYPSIMKELRIFQCQFAEGTEHVVARMIQNCPELRNVVFSNVENMDVLTRELVKIDKLAKLHLHNIHCPLENELQRLFDKHVALDDESQLFSIRFCNMTTVSDVVVDGLRSLKALKYLELNVCSGMTSQKLCSVIPDIQMLSEIKLRQVMAVDDQLIRALGSIEVVRLISLNIHDASVRYLIEHSKCLEMLEVRSCNCSPETLTLGRSKEIRVIGP
ncbi:hypothetical protein BDA99DRAFT_507340 [Phascolomyces articulosus]|uniref:F-box domain-containing protein n=1 Tax=Phascolomyces articulosus TaxID=60185 RepID=A0AAD5KB16_9FUNG|nr:hypothetical protein BDA99DRAFT_507340 [Phascolomyces articulosus]